MVKHVDSVEYEERVIKVRYLCMWIWPIFQLNYSIFFS